MKRFLVLTGCFLTLTCACFAQDVIVTRDSRKINAIVTQVNDKDVSYKYFDDPNGYTYILQKSEIVTILYHNGQVETFDTENVSSQAVTPVPVQSTAQSYQSQPQIQRTSSSYQDNARIVQLTTKDLVNRMSVDNPRLYRQYRSGSSRYANGWGMIGVGFMMTVQGSFLLYNDLSGPYDFFDSLSAVGVIGAVFVIAGDVLITVGIPVAITGKVSKSRALNAYRDKYFSEKATKEPSFKLNLHNNGVGLAYVF